MLVVSLAITALFVGALGAEEQGVIAQADLEVPADSWFGPRCDFPGCAVPLRDRRRRRCPAHSSVKPAAKTCQHDGCSRELPRVKGGRRYCDDHRTPEGRHRELAPAPAARKDDLEAQERARRIPALAEEIAKGERLDLERQRRRVIAEARAMVTLGRAILRGYGLEE